MAMQVDFTKIIPLFSAPKFEACRLLGGSDEDTCARFRWNVALAEALYPALQGLEVGFRNRIHERIAAAVGKEDWFAAGFLYQSEKEMVADAQAALADRNKPITIPLLIAELKFGFWTSLADKRYDKMWPKIIKSVFPTMPNHMRTRIEISRRLNKARHLRNSVFHHHSIWHWQDLKEHHDNVYDLMRWMEPEYAILIQARDRFPQVFADGHEPYL